MDSKQAISRSSVPVARSTSTNRTRRPRVTVTPQKTTKRVRVSTSTGVITNLGRYNAIPEHERGVVNTFNLPAVDMIVSKAPSPRPIQECCGECDNRGRANVIGHQTAPCKFGCAPGCNTTTALYYAWSRCPSLEVTDQRWSFCHSTLTAEAMNKHFGDYCQEAHDEIDSFFCGKMFRAKLYWKKGGNRPDILYIYATARDC